MKYIRSLTQQRLCLMLAVYIGLFLNGAVLFRRVEGYFEHLTVRNGILPRLKCLAQFWRPSSCYVCSRFWQTYMAGSGLAGGGYLRRRKLLHDIHECGHWLRYCGLGDDHGHRPLERVVGQGFILWTILTCLIPLFFIWSNTCRYTCYASCVPGDSASATSPSFFWRVCWCGRLFA